MWRLDLGQTVMQNPGHFWQLMKTELICAIVMMYLWVGRDLWVEEAEHNPLSNDRLLPLVCVCISKSSPPLLFLLCFTCQPNLSYSCAGGAKCCIINIWITLQKRKHVWFTHRAVLKRLVCVSKNYTVFNPGPFCTEIYRRFCSDWYVESFMNIPSDGCWFPIKKYTGCRLIYDWTIHWGQWLKKNYAGVIQHGDRRGASQ